MRMRWGVAFLVLATLAQVFALTASASLQSVKLSGRAVVANTREPIVGMTILVFNKPLGKQDQLPLPIGRAVTTDTGRFSILVPRETVFTAVTVMVVAPEKLPCASIALIGVVGAATAYGAKKEATDFRARSDGRLNQDTSYSTFEMIGTINLDGSVAGLCGGSIGLYTAREEE